MTTELARIPPTLAQIERAIIAQSFPDFLAHVQLRSDDPQHPGAIPFQQWPHLMERARSWAEGKSEVILKARQEGYTWAASAFLAWKGRRGASCAVISVGQNEARDVIARVRYIEEHMPLALATAVSWTADEVRYHTGGTVRAFPSTEHAGISYTFQVVVMDEAGFHPYGAANYTAIRPTLSAGGQFIAISTADPSRGQSGFFYDLYWDAVRGENPYTAVFAPWNARPGRDAEWLAGEARAFKGRMQDFAAYYPSTPEEAFIGRAGLAFPEFKPSIHVVPESEIPSTWTRWTSTDYGYVDPFATVWLARSPDRQHVMAYRELYVRGLTAREQAKRIKQLDGNERIQLRIGDPSMWSAREKLSNESIAEEYAMEHVFLSPANNDRLAGKAKIHEALAKNEQHPELPPRLLITAACPELIRTLSTLPLSQNRPEDVDTKADDHLYDCLRYGLMVEGQRTNPERSERPFWRRLDIR